MIALFPALEREACPDDDVDRSLISCADRRAVEPAAADDHETRRRDRHGWEAIQLLPVPGRRPVNSSGDENVSPASRRCTMVAAAGPMPGSACEYGLGRRVDVDNAVAPDRDVRRHGQAKASSPPAPARARRSGRSAPP